MIFDIEMVSRIVRICLLLSESEMRVPNRDSGEGEAGVLLPCFANKRLISIKIAFLFNNLASPFCGFITSQFLYYINMSATKM